MLAPIVMELAEGVIESSAIAGRLAFRGSHVRQQLVAEWIGCQIHCRRQGQPGRAPTGFAADHLFQLGAALLDQPERDCGITEHISAGGRVHPTGGQAFKQVMRLAQPAGLRQQYDLLV